MTSPHFFGITDKGLRRDNNEDTFIVQEIAGSEYLLACVIDGVGGYKGGEVAAEIARTVILENVQNLPGDIIQTLEAAIIAANERIQLERNGNEHNASMACVLTCAVVDIKNNKLFYAHVGDTRLYLLRDASLVKISKDHSAIGFLEESGRLSEDDAMRHPRRNEINKALGFEAQIADVENYIETGESPFLPGDTILLCSDGLSDMIGSAAITSILNKHKPLATKAQQLIDAANEAGGNDNITAVLVENTKQPKKLSALKPADKKNGVDPSHAQQDGTAPAQIATATINSNKGVIILLALICMGLLAALTVTLFKQNAAAKNNELVAQKNTAAPKHEQLIQLTAAVNDTVKTYAMPAGGSFIVSEPILISKDSFYLLGNGTHIIADSNYKGPAFSIGNTAKYIVLDSLVFENFNAALLIQKNNIILKNVRFINCIMPVQYGATFTDTTISGRFKDSIFITTQPLKKQ